MFMESSLTEPEPAAGPRIHVLSLGAGPQSTALLLLACEGRIPRFDAAIFADPGWQHEALYQRVDQLKRLAAKVGIPLYRVTAGNVRADALDPDRRFASMPLWYRSPTGHDTTARRQCVSRYKTGPVKAKIRELLGYPPPARVPRGIHADLAVGLAADEIGRAREPDVQYLEFSYPLSVLGWTTADCVRYLISRGMSDALPSACLGCPYHGNRWWRHMRDHEPKRWADAVAFDHAIRDGHPRANVHGQHLHGRYYLHMSRQPLEQANLGPIRILNGLPGYVDEDGIPGGCSPWTRPADQAPPVLPRTASTIHVSTIQRHWANAISLGRAITRRLAAGLTRHRTSGPAVKPAGRHRR